MNSVQLTGRITRINIKPVGQTQLCEFSIAFNEKYKGQDKTSFFDWKAWGQLAETIYKHFEQGKMISVVGRMEQETWERDGDKRSKITFTANNFFFVNDGGGKGNGESTRTQGESQGRAPASGRGGRKQQSKQQQPQQETVPSYGGPDNNGDSGDDSIPF